MAFSTLTATVTQVTPSVLVIVDGADTASPATVQTGITVLVNDRATIENRSPQMPHITGVEETTA